MSAVHLKPDSSFCGGTLLPLNKFNEQQLMGVSINGVTISGFEFKKARCIACGTEVFLNAPTRLPQEINVEYEVIKEGSNEVQS